MNDFEVSRAISAIYDAVNSAHLKAGLPTIYIEDTKGQERRYSINDILKKKEMPGELTKTYFEFRNGGDFSLICFSLDDCSFKTDNFTEEDETTLNSILKQIDLERPLPIVTVPEPIQISLEAKEYEPEIVSLASLFPEPEATTPEPAVPPTLQSTVKRRASNILSEDEFKKYATQILREDRNKTFQQILEKYSSDGFKLSRSYKGSMRRKDEMCDWYLQVRKNIKMDTTSNFGNFAKVLPKQPTIQQKIPAAKPRSDSVPSKKKIVQSIETPTQNFPEQKTEKPKPEKVPTPTTKAEIKQEPKKKLVWNDKNVLGIVKSEYEKKHNFSQTLASLIGMGYKISKTNKAKVYGYFTELMGI